MIAYVQNGVQAGQTVPHSHMHLLTRPIRIAFLAHVLSEGLGFPPDFLSKQEMQTIRKIILPILYQELTLKAPVQKPIFSLFFESFPDRNDKDSYKERKRSAASLHHA